MWSMPREAEGGPHLWNGVLSWKYWPLDSYFTSVLHVFRDTVLHSVATGLGPGAVRWASCLTSAKAARVCVSVIQCGASLGSLWWKELKINGNTLNSVNFGSGSHSIRVAVLIWNALFQPWLRLILYNSKPHGFCSWNWKGLRNSHSSEVICGLWGMSIPWHALPSCSSDCQIRNLTRAWDDSFQLHGLGFCLERCTGLILMLKD